MGTRLRSLCSCYESVDIVTQPVAQGETQLELDYEGERVSDSDLLEHISCHRGVETHKSPKRRAKKTGVSVSHI
jgi:hypothetical protein